MGASPGKTSQINYFRLDGAAYLVTSSMVSTGTKRRLSRTTGSISARSRRFSLGMITVNGLAWTEVGGELLEVEVNVMEGSGKLELTGNLGDVMKESAQAAVSCIRSRAAQLGIDPEFHKNRDIHIRPPRRASRVTRRMAVFRHSFPMVRSRFRTPDSRV